MDYETLVETDIEKGQRVIDALHDDEIDVDVAFWAKLSIYDSWRLFVTAQSLDNKPLLEARAEASRAIDGKFAFSEPPVIVLRTSDPMAVAVREEAAKRKGTGPIRLPMRQFSNRFIEDGWVYRTGAVVQ